MPFFRDLRGRGNATRNEQSPPPPGCKEWLQRRIALSGTKLDIFAWYFQELNTQAAKKSNKKDN